MLVSSDEVQKANGEVVNGVDNPNLMSVDSTTPLVTAADEVKSEETVAPPSGQEKKEEVKEEKKEEKPVIEEKKTEEKKDEKSEEKKEEKKEEEKEEDTTKFPDAVQKRIDKLTKKMRTFEREKEYERSKRLEAEKELETFKSKVPSSEKPKREDYIDDDDYLEALADWKIDQKMKVKDEGTEKKIVEDKDKEELGAVYEKIDNMIEEGKEKYSDFETVALAKDVKVTPDMVEIILETSNSADVLYYLGKNPDIAKEISEMSPLKAARKIAGIEDELKKPLQNKEEKKEESKAPVEEKKKEESKAPPPIEPPKASGVSETDPSKMSMAEYRRWREKNK